MVWTKETSFSICVISLQNTSHTYFIKFSQPSFSRWFISAVSWRFDIVFYFYCLEKTGKKKEDLLLSQTESLHLENTYAVFLNQNLELKYLNHTYGNYSFALRHQKIYFKQSNWTQRVRRKRRTLRAITLIQIFFFWCALSSHIVPAPAFFSFKFLYVIICERP